jgi:PKD repeat protein
MKTPGIRTLLFFAVLLFAAKVSPAQQARNFDSGSTPGFLENKGQVRDQDGRPRPDVKFIYDHRGLRLILSENSFSYEICTVEKPSQLISEATGKLIEKKPGGEISLPQNEKLLVSRVDVTLEGANPHPDITVEGKTGDFVNYYKQYTGESGITGIYVYKKIIYHNIYDHIDFEFIALEDGTLKYNIILRPGGRLSDVQLAYSGMNGIVASGSKLEVSTTLGSLTESIPVSYLKSSGKLVEVCYASTGNIIHFNADYDKDETLVIDPVITRQWATYYAGSQTDASISVAVDDSGNVYMAGLTGSTSSIATTGAFKTTFAGGYYDIYLVKFNSGGNRLWATYYGGSSDETGGFVALDGSGNVYLTGYTKSTAGISTSGSHQSSYAGGFSDAFLVKFNGEGVRQWATYYGGSDADFSKTMAVDDSGYIYIAGQTSSSSGIATPGAYRTVLPGAAFLAKFNSSGIRIWGTYFGGDDGLSIAVDSASNVYMCGFTYADTGIATTGAYQTVRGGNKDVFLVKFSSSGKRLWSTYYGGIADESAYALSAGPFGNIIMSGSTESSAGIASSGAYQKIYGGKQDVFLVKFNSSGNRLWATYYGGSNTEGSGYIATDVLGNIYLPGLTLSTSGISSPGAFQGSLAKAGFLDAFLVKFDSSGARKWGTYYGGDSRDYASAVAVDNLGFILMSGTTESSNGIATTGAHQIMNGGGQDAFLVQFRDSASASLLSKYDAGIYSFDSPDSAYCGSKTMKVIVKVKNYFRAPFDSVYIGWSVNDTLQKPIRYNATINGDNASLSILMGSHFFPIGTNNLKIWTYKPQGAADINNSNDTLSMRIIIHAAPAARFFAQNACYGDAVDFTDSSKIASGNIISWFWKFGDNESSTVQNPAHTYDSAGSYMVRLITTSDNGCIDSTSQTITIYPLPQASFIELGNCPSEPNIFSNTSTIANGYSISKWLWDFGDSTTDTVKAPFHSYASEGTYTVTLSATSNTGCKSVASRQITIYSKPKAAFSTTNVCLGEKLILKEESSNAVQYLWSFGNAHSDTIANPEYTYPDTGDYTITLHVKNSHGCQDFFEKKITIYPPPKAKFTTGTTCAGSAVNFFDSSEGHISSWHWDFADGSNDSVKNPIHKFFSSGTYTVRLRVYNVNGCMDMISAPVTIHDLPTLSLHPDTICISEPYKPTVASSGAASWIWYFGDGQSSTDSLPAHTYSDAGIYSLKVIAANADGCRDSATAQLTVNALPQAGFSIIQNPSYIQVVPDDMAAGNTYLWDFGDESTSNIRNPVHTYARDSTYIITLTITNADKCSNSSRDTVSISSGIRPLEFKELNVWLYPNPLQDFLIIRCMGSDCDKNLQLTLTDMLGREMLNKDISGEGDLKIETSGLKAGAYLIHLSDGNKLFTRSILKQ